MHSTVTKKYFLRLFTVNKLNQSLKHNEMKATINRTVTESKTGRYFSTLSGSKRSLWAQYRNFNR